ncbi:meiotic cohesin protection protein, shugoshin, Sgo1 [Schizosaccharomyces osmophilus]|uniref:Meiotic cohesin protection protein, shugoshin, Sgo1 n=1 Tax=Schizosaccharomyces osmophilus TaxID=2545709 RepID=A0AAF0ASJ6_9SCHI|nr:meiotic cohesin protection protein, shugoshin, Sgo1 [Schizosaccharomyces osmophilus]WBW70981.1 meiotic cohesin protection protein, shugoshin, Sgo1 [Schizosaccharomyces osmophilus]
MNKSIPIQCTKEEDILFIESLKKRFLKQNREIIRVNTQLSAKLSESEIEMEKLLRDNCQLKNSLIKLESRVQIYSQSESLYRQYFQDFQRIRNKLSEVHHLMIEMDEKILPPSTAIESSTNTSSTLNDGVDERKGQNVQRNRYPPLIKDFSVPDLENPHGMNLPGRKSKFPPLPKLPSKCILADKTNTCASNSKTTLKEMKPPNHDIENKKNSKEKEKDFSQNETKFPLGKEVMKEQVNSKPSNVRVCIPSKAFDNVTDFEGKNDYEADNRDWDMESTGTVTTTRGGRERRAVKSVNYAIPDLRMKLRRSFELPKDKKRRRQCRMHTKN